MLVGANVEAGWGGVGMEWQWSGGGDVGLGWDGLHGLKRGGDRMRGGEVYRVW